MKNDTTRIDDTIAETENDFIMYDETCKKLLSEKIVLGRILSEYVEEFKGLDATEIAQKYIDGDVLISPKITGDAVNHLRGLPTEDNKIHGASIKYDILFNALVPGTDDLVGVIINVEAQNRDDPGYPLLTRGIYYGARLIAGQKNDSVGFSNSNYGDIRKVYSIWICLNPPIEKQNAVNLYHITEQHIDGNLCANEDYYDIMSVVMIYLQGVYNDNEVVDNAKKMLNMLFAKNLKKEQKYKHMESYGIMTPSTKKGVDAMCNFSEGIYDDGYAAGQARTIYLFVKNGLISIQQALDMAEIFDEEMRSKITKLIESGKVAE